MERMRPLGLGWVAAIAIGLLGPGTAWAQAPDSTKPKPTPRDTAIVDTLKKEAQREVLSQAHVVRWYEVVAVLGGVAALTAVDEPAQRYVQRHRSKTLDDISSAFRREGQPEYYATVSLGVLAVGAVTGNAPIQRAGGRLVASVAMAGIATEGVKRLVGRSRPNEHVGAFQFHPFTSVKDSAGVQTRGALPSGHTMAAFAVATSLADDIKSPVVHVLLYTFAAGTAWSRINDNRHWLSDTALGAALGITSAKLVSGHWRIFNLKPPGFLVTPTGAPALAWRMNF
jgi:membrane-associated phospholipid phosphatase